MSNSKKYLLFESTDQLDQNLRVGGKLKIKVNGKPFCLVRKNDKIIAFEDQCPHLGESLFSGHLNAMDEIVCPWHSFRFNLGNGEESENRCSNLRFAKVWQDSECVYLELTDS